MGDPRDPFGRPLDTHPPVVMTEEEARAAAAERDADEADDPLSDLDDEVEAALGGGE